MFKEQTIWAKPAALEWSEKENTFLISISLDIYSIDAILKTCYLFLDTLYIFAEPDPFEKKINLYLSPQDKIENMPEIIGEFSNRLLWQEVRGRISDETRPIREMIVKQAFTEISALENDRTGEDYNLDPLEIGN